jgi:DNA (cytosine-5)-methyltransferase 1
VITARRSSQGIGYDAINTEGALVDEILRITSITKPRVVLMENVPDFLTANGGDDYTRVRDQFYALGYDTKYRTIDASLVVPQRRNRLFMVAFADYNVADNFRWPTIIPEHWTLGDILQTPGAVESGKVLFDPLAYTVSNMAIESFFRRSNGNWKTTIVSPDAQTNSLTPSYCHSRREILVAQPPAPNGVDRNPRFLSPRECARLMGYPDAFDLVCSNEQTYKQLGNAVVPGIARHIATSIVSALRAVDGW